MKTSIARLPSLWAGAAMLAAACLHLPAMGAEGVTPTEILIGQVADFSGPLAGNVKEGTEVVAAYFDSVNKAGGVHGRKVTLVSVDDGYDPKKTVALAKELIESKGVLALTLGRGTSNAEAIMPVLAAARVPMVGFAGGSVAMHSPPNRYLFNLRPPYRIEAQRAAEQLAAQGISSIAAVYTDDAFGKDAMVGFDAVAKNKGIRLTDTIALPRGSADVAPAIAKITASNPQAVIAVCVVKPCAALRKGLQAAGYLGQFLSLSNTSSAAFVQELGAAARGVIVTQVFPSPDMHAIGVSSDFERLADTYKLRKSYTAMEGYVYARVLVEALKRAGPGVTRESLTETLQSPKKFDLGGYVIGFDPNNRTGSNVVELTMITRNGRFMR